jgi:hypothetical protein
MVVAVIAPSVSITGVTVEELVRGPIGQLWGARNVTNNYDTTLRAKGATWELRKKSLANTPAPHTGERRILPSSGSLNDGVPGP